MTATTDAPFPDLPMDPDAIFEAILDPSNRDESLVRLYHQLRSVAPIYHCGLERVGRPWVITRHADLATLAREPNLIKDERLVDQLGGDPSGAFTQVMKGMMNFIPAPRHTRLRQLVNRGFTLQSVEQLRPGVRKVIQGIIDAQIDKGEMDLASDFAFHIPMTMICELLGVPLEDIPQIHEFASAITLRSDEAVGLTPEQAIAGDQAMQSFSDYFQHLIDMRRASPDDGLISRLVAVQREADDLSDADIIATSVLLFQAGHDTTANLIAKGTLALLKQRDQWEKLKARPELIVNATEELLRFDTSVQLSVNYAIADVPYHDRTIENGDAVILLRGAANRDPARFADPDRLDIERKDIDHHSFGLGAHFCLGASLARLEIQEAIGALSQRLPNLELTEQAPTFKPQLHLHGLKSLKVRW